MIVCTPNKEINCLKPSKPKPAKFLPALFVAFSVFEKPVDNLLSEVEQGLSKLLRPSPEVFGRTG